MSIYQPYSKQGGVPPSGNVSNVQQTAGLAPSTLLMSSFISRLPFAYQIIDSMVRNNPKFYSFKNQASLKDQMLEDQSVFMSQPDFSGNAAGSFSVNKDYQAFVYASIDKDKGRRIMDYRRMAAYAELADCLDEICDECIVTNDNGEIVRFKLMGSFSKTVQDEISNEFKKFIEIYDLENTGWEKFRQMLVEGELFFENLIKEGKEDYGIIGLMSIPSELINPVFHNVQNELLKGFLLQKPVMGPIDSTTSPDQQQLLFLQKAQVSYIHSGLWNEFKTFRLPFIENCKRAYRQLSLIEDSVVIYRLVRAPERLVFKVYTGNMPQPKAESHIKSMMMKYWSKKTYNGAEQRVSNIYDPQSMLDSYWFPKDAQGNGTDVQPLNSTGCLAMNTKIPLLDGRTLTIAEMAAEFDQGKENWVYSTNPSTGEVVPGLVTWAGVTQKSAKVMELVFDNGKTLVCTPDHKFPILGKGFVEAKDLLIGESLIPFNVKKELISKNGNDYEMVYQNHTKQWEFTHRMVNKYMANADFCIEMIHDERYAKAPKNVVHHKDFNRFNNNPTNLVRMNRKDHIVYHKGRSKQVIEALKQQPENYAKFLAKKRESAKKAITEYLEKLTPEEKENRANISRQNRLLGTVKSHTDSECIEKRVTNIRKGWAKAKEEYSESYQKCFERGQKLFTDKWQNSEFRQLKIDHQTLTFDKTVFDFALKIIAGRTTHEVTGKQVVDAINANTELKNHFLKLNEDKRPKNWDRSEFKLTHLACMAKQFGYKNWNHLRKEALFFNHKLVAVNYFEEPIEVGTLTIDGKEEFHDFHTFALDCGVFTKNSLGEIKDLDYFLTKLYKTLKVPVSRFMTAGDAFKDGAEITRDELRFARFVMRLQSQFAAGIKETFITHLKLKGLWKEYKLKDQAIKIHFNEPTSFMAMRNQQLLKIKFDNFAAATQGDSIAKSYAQKHYLEMSADEMKENRDWLRVDAALKWELNQIEQNGPDFRKQIAAQQQASTEGAPSGGAPEGTPPDMGGGAPGEEDIPEFGGGSEGAVAPETGGAEAAPAPETPPAPEAPLA